MKILFIHQGFPGQYLQLANHLSCDSKNTVFALGMRERSGLISKRVYYIKYGANRQNGAGTHPLALEYETKIIRAEACAHAANKLKAKGLTPDIICGHPGWGELLFIPEIWPATPILMYQEFYYRPRGSDLDFDPEFSSINDWQDSAKTYTKNAHLLLSLESAAWNVSPTVFQKNCFPHRYHQQISVIHDGVNPAAAPWEGEGSPLLKLRDGTTVSKGEKLITFANRNIEPYRGSHSFMRSIPEILKRIPDARIVIAGNERGVSYGYKDPVREWKDIFLAEIEGQYDKSRVHFSGPLAYGDFIKLLQVSMVHVYLTYPFVLSWSLLEAMSTGCAVIGSDCEPVREFLKHESNGLVVDFFSSTEIVESIELLIRNRDYASTLGHKARRDITKEFSLSKCLKKHSDLIHTIATGNSPNPGSDEEQTDRESIK